MKSCGRQQVWVVVMAACVSACGGNGQQSGGGDVQGTSTSSSAGGASSSSGGQVEVIPLPTLEHTQALPDLNPDPDVVEVELSAVEAMHTYRDGQLTPVYAYNAQVPGPAIQARVGNRVIVHFNNHLPESTTIHWHGMRVPNEMDGTPHTQVVVAPGGSFVYDFVVQDAGNYWYHPHYNSSQQIERGLMGPLVVHEAEAPAFDAERVVFLDDVRLSTSGRVSPFQASGMDLMHGRSGNTLLTNGMQTPPVVSARAGRRERWRLFNGSNARTMLLTVEGAVFQIIGTDGGLLPQPHVVDQVELAVGQRFDLDVMFTAAPLEQVKLVSHVPVLDANDNVVLQPIPVFTVQLTDEAPQEIPVVVASGPALPALPADLTPARSVVLSGEAVNGVVQFSINGHVWPDVEHWEVNQGTDLVVRITNDLGMEHPFHVHGQFFQVLGRRGQQEPGLKDTVLLGGSESVDVVIHFSNPGQWMYHCHINEHAEAGMMGHLNVVPSP